MTPYWGSVFFAFFAQGDTMIQEMWYNMLSPLTK